MKVCIHMVDDILRDFLFQINIFNNYEGEPKTVKKTTNWSHWHVFFKYKNLQNLLHICSWKFVYMFFINFIREIFNQSYQWLWFHTKKVKKCKNLQNFKNTLILTITLTLTPHCKLPGQMRSARIFLYKLNVAHER